MPVVKIGSQRFTTVVHLDPPGDGNACHHYEVCKSGPSQEAQEEMPVYAGVHFQDGPIGEWGVNGCSNEDLLVIVLHRLQGFQSGAWACEENQRAIATLCMVLGILNARTVRRQAEGGEGTSAL